MTTISPSDVEKRLSENFYIGLGLAILSTIFIGSSFVVKKLALKRLERTGKRAGEGGYGYLKDCVWWLGLLLIGVGEISNFVAYAFAPASLVTPLGGLSVLFTAILSSRFLDEHLNIIGKIGCVVCLSGASVIVIHAPKEQDIESMHELMHKYLSIGFLVYSASIVLVVVILIFYLGPRYGKASPLIYLSISGLIGSLTVMACKGIGVGIREAFIKGPNEVLTHWLFWTLICLLLCAIVIQMNYLNIALDIFNTNIVTPLLYVIFTGSVLVASAVLYHEFSVSRPEDHVGNLSGLLCVVSGIFLLTAFKDLEVTWRDIKIAFHKKQNALDQTSTASDLQRLMSGQEGGDDEERPLRFPHFRRGLLHKFDSRATYRPILRESASSSPNHLDQCDADDAENLVWSDQEYSRQRSPPLHEPYQVSRGQHAAIVSVAP